MMVAQDVRLQQLFPKQNLGVFAEQKVNNLCLDSRDVTDGDVFFAVGGSQLDGREFIEDAIAAGAKIIVQDADDHKFSCRQKNQLLYVFVPQLRLAVSSIAAEYFNHPSGDIKAVGITGTNGKTTCSVWLAQLLNGLGESAAIIGTLGFGKVGDELITTGMTTPNAIDTQRIISQLCRGGVGALVAEVSSHSLDQYRVAGVAFDVGVLTNISRDHLDYHGDMKSYAEAKTKLMAFESLSAVVLNKDDSYCHLFSAAANKPVLTYSIKGPADFYASSVTLNSEGIAFVLNSPTGNFSITLPIWGRFNLSNVMAVITSAYALGYGVDDIVGQLKVLASVPGRLEPVSTDSDDISVLVDFAHTPEALESVLQAVTQHTNGNVTCVIGCGGDRDKGKRPLMAEAAERNSQMCIITSDNPRTEQPQDIIDDMIVGLSAPDAATIIVDRAQAIHCAIVNAAPGDCVVLAGKGHEDYQLIDGVKIPFSDVTQARIALADRMGALQ